MDNPDFRSEKAISQLKALLKLLKLTPKTTKHYQFMGEFLNDKKTRLFFPFFFFFLTKQSPYEALGFGGWEV